MLPSIVLEAIVKYDSFYELRIFGYMEFFYVKTSIYHYKKLQIINDLFLKITTSVSNNTAILVLPRSVHLHDNASVHLHDNARQLKGRVSLTACEIAEGWKSSFKLQP